MAILSKQLPLEIWMIIVEFLESKARVRSLRALSRCCRALACLCQRVLFRDLHISRGYRGFLLRRAGALVRLEEAFTQSPHLATYVRKVRYAIDEEDSENTTVQWILNQLTDSLSDVKVEYVSKISSMPYLDWDTLDARLRSSIMHVVESPRLKTLSLSWIKNMPMSIFVSLSSDLTTVKLEGVEVKKEQDLDEIESTNSDSTPRQVDLAQMTRRLPHIKSLHYYDHDTGGVLASRPFVFDFEELQFLQISWGNVPQCALGTKLIKAANRLEGLACAGKYPQLLWLYEEPLMADELFLYFYAVDSPEKSAAGLAKAMLDYGLDVNLTSLMVGLSHRTTSPTIPDPDEDDLFLGLIEEFELLAGKNAVKYLMVHFDTTQEAHDMLTGCLSRFDEVIIREAFPHLERFELEIWVHYSGPNYAPYGSGLEDCWAERNRAQCQGVSAIPGLRSGCLVEIMCAHD
ncbi:unnamed protein product [Cyclocybe aegerita]|uniref:F-box domain-containing protein n=1 Tax=Cyclocybe aegerita TaxID=1973307 RepID=A0A8S0VXN4_CYCAE|nr:unnamed protein product [Cyclocybe aegerita]